MLGLAGLVLVVGPVVWGGRLPGDAVDARFNSFLLEHFYRWVTGQDPHFWTNGSYYPFPLTTALSDNFLGDGPVYALFRLVGADRVSAFEFWFVTGAAANFIAAYFALKGLGYGRVATAFGAFLFAFSLPATGQETHAQLAYRFAAPIAVLFLLRLRRGGSVWNLPACILFLAWQFYCSIYIGYFLSLLLGALWLSTTGRPSDSDDRVMGGWVPAAIWQASRLEQVGSLLACLLLAGLMALLFGPYVEVGRLYAMKRSWSEIWPLLPRPQSYLMAYNSRIWPSRGGLFDAVPAPMEQSLFIGAAPFVAMAIAAFLRVKGGASQDPLVRPMAIAVLLLVVLTLINEPVYRLIAAAPGASAIRAVSRIILVLLFPLGALLASAIDAILHSRMAQRTGVALAGLIGAFMVFESADVTHWTTSRDEWRTRSALVARDLPRHLPAEPILYSAAPPKSLAFRTDLDAMIVAQDHGWPTVNGYSNPNRPPGFVDNDPCDGAYADLEAGLRLSGRPLPTTLGRRLVVTGLSNCAGPKVSPR
jgi:hypothetical protein